MFLLEAEFTVVVSGLRHQDFGTHVAQSTPRAQTHGPMTVAGPGLCIGHGVHH